MSALEVIVIVITIATAIALVVAVLALRRAPAEGVGERLERELRAAIDASASQVRIETGARLTELQTALVTQSSSLSQTQTAQLGQFGQHLTDLTRSIQLSLADVRNTLNTQLLSLAQGNETKLDQMRATVEEKLEVTLQARLGESFKQVSDRLEQVHRGLGEMQSLAQGVGDLKRVLLNVKSRGMYGEVQLAALLEQVLAPEQYATNVQTRPGSNERVEFAVKFPGRDDGIPVWLPIDAKFPTEDYERLLAAQEAADKDALEVAGRALEMRIRAQAKTIREKYVEPPYTTDFGVLFVPTEGLFAEALRRPGLAEALNRELRILLAGPTTLFAMLNSLQMGFRTLALEKRAAEVWQVLGAVKSEFNKFGDVLIRLRGQLETATKTIDSAETRTRQIGRALRGVEELPVDETEQLFPNNREP